MRTEVVLLISILLGCYSNALKKGTKGNSCPEDRPFPCRNSDICIPIRYLCDDNWDCEDGYDENTEVCTAVKRLPAEEMERLLTHEKWMTQKLFPGKTSKEIAFAFAVSPTLTDFKERLGLSDGEADSLAMMIKAVAAGKKSMLRKMGMKPSAWSELRTLFEKLVKTGFV